MLCNEQQTAVFATLVLCQPDNVGSSLTSFTQSHDAYLLKMLQEKLFFVLQTIIFPNPPMDPISNALISQTLFSEISNLRHLSELYQRLIQTVAPPSPPIKPIVDAKPEIAYCAIPQVKNNGLLESLAAAASREYSTLNKRLLLDSERTKETKRVEVTTENPQWDHLHFPIINANGIFDYMHNQIMSHHNSFRNARP